MVDALKDAKVIFVIGGPGSGKGTQCEKIVVKYGFNHLSSGDLLRGEVQSGSASGKEINEIMQRGELVPLASTDIVLCLLKNAMEGKVSQCPYFLLDGYPRTCEQSDRFEKEIIPSKFILYFDVCEDEMKQRILKRGESSGRVDDNEQAALKRLQTFKEETMPVVQKFSCSNNFIKINGNGSIDEVFESVVQEFAKRGIC